MFVNMDTDKSGSITYEELKTGLARLGSKLSVTKIKQLMEATYHHGELETAMKNYGMGNEADIKDILSEVDVDNASTTGIESILRYYDEASFTGDVEKVDHATNLHYRGARIFDVMLEELLSKGLNKASRFNSTSRGMFINSCYFHCQTRSKLNWLGKSASKLDNKAIAKVVINWFYERNTTELINREHKLPQQC